MSNGKLPTGGMTCKYHFKDHWSGAVMLWHGGVTQ